MTAPEEPSTEFSSPDHDRSGADIAEAIEVAERGSSVQEVHDRGTEAKSGEAPVEQRRGDPEMTEGQVVLGAEPQDGGDAGTTAEQQSSGAAQSVRGARPIDRLAAGEPRADG